MLPKNLPTDLIPELVQDLSNITLENSPNEVAKIVTGALVKHRAILNGLRLSAPDLTSILNEARPRAWRPAVQTIRGYAKDARVKLAVGPRGNGLAERAREKHASLKDRVANLIKKGTSRADLLVDIYNRRSPQDAGRLNKLLREIAKDSLETDPKLSAEAKKLLNEKVSLDSALCGAVSAGRHLGRRVR